MIDLTTQFGRNVLWRLKSERIVWFLTTSIRNIPQPRPVWFYWDGESFLIYSKPNTRKIQHIKTNPNVALHFDGDGMGGNIMVFIGEAQVDMAIPPADEVAGFTIKYQEGFARINMSAAEFAQAYSVPIRVQPRQLRGH